MFHRLRFVTSGDDLEIDFWLHGVKLHVKAFKIANNENCIIAPTILQHSVQVLLLIVVPGGDRDWVSVTSGNSNKH